MILTNENEKEDANKAVTLVVTKCVVDDHVRISGMRESKQTNQKQINKYLYFQVRYKHALFLSERENVH